MKSDDARTVEQLAAELRQLRAENASLRQREAALTGELAEARVLQTAMDEILPIMRTSPPDTQLAFGAIARSATRLCDAVFSGVHLFDGQRITLDAQHNIQPDELQLLQRRVFPLRPLRESAVGRAVHDRSPVHIDDIRDDPNYRLPVLQSSASFRTVLAVPMLRDGVPVGAISVWRREVWPYSEQQIGLVETFASRAMLLLGWARPAASRRQFDDLLADRLLGRIAVSQRDWEAAQAYLQAAEAHARQQGLAWELARILEARASVLARTGHGSGSTASALLEEALNLYERLDERIEVARVRERLPGRAQHGRRRALPAGLSVREAEVLRLVAAGLSNREIAGALCLSEKTVENHLTNLYGKIGADNRAAASAFAVRHGLA